MEGHKSPIDGVQKSIAIVGVEDETGAFSTNCVELLHAILQPTGGLKDSVEEFDTVRGKGTGFVFHSYDGDALLNAIDRALMAFHRKEDWAILMKNAMTAD